MCRTLIAVGVLAVLSGCANMGNTQRCVLPDVDAYPQQVFSFHNGIVVISDSQDKLDAPDFTLIFDMPNGLGSYSRTLSDDFNEDGGLCDMGAVPLSSVTNAPAAGYLPLLKPEQIATGHTYCVRASDGRTVWKMQVVRLNVNTNNENKSAMEFEWDTKPLK